MNFPRTLATARTAGAPLRIGAAAVFIAAFLNGCFTEEKPPEIVQGGGSSETTNGMVMGRVLDSSGAPAAGASLRLRSRAYLADTTSALARLGSDALDAVTDAEGFFRFDSLDPGGYLIEARGFNGGSSLFEVGVVAGDSIVLEPRMLASDATVRGRIDLDSGSAGQGYVQVFGLERVQRADPATGAFAFTDLPAGVYTLRASTSAPRFDPHILTGVRAAAAQVVDVGTFLVANFEAEDYSTWPSHRRVYFNTTTGGAGIADTLLDFPVLVRLNAGRIDFSTATPGNVRFSNRHGKPLPYEVEDWDALAERAAVWVRVDTVFGHDNKAYLDIHYGMPSVPDWSNGQAVFDTAQGFGAVWHLKEEAADTLTNRLYLDATAFEHHADDRVADPTREWFIGMANHFRSHDHVRARAVESLKPTRQFTLSAWFKTQGPNDPGGDIASMGDGYGIRVDAAGDPAVYLQIEGESWKNVIARGLGLNDSAWHHLAAVYDSTLLKLYVDGELIREAAYTGSIPYTLGQDFVIGAHGNGQLNYDYTGFIDEVQMSRVPRSADWIRLSFESQRLNGTLLEFR